MAFAELSSITQNTVADDRLFEVRSTVEDALSAYVDWARKSETNLRDHVHDLEAALEQIVAWFESSKSERARESSGERGLDRARESWATSDRDSWPAIDSRTALSRRFPPSLLLRPLEPPDPVSDSREDDSLLSDGTIGTDSWSRLAAAYLQSCRCAYAIFRDLIPPAAQHQPTAPSSPDRSPPALGSAAACLAATPADATPEQPASPAAETIAQLQAECAAARRELEDARAECGELEARVAELERCAEARRGRRAEKAAMILSLSLSLRRRRRWSSETAAVIP